MHISKTLFHQIQIRCSTQDITKIILLFISLAILVLASLKMLQPIANPQLNNVIKLSQQAAYPQTQHMAIYLLQQDQINKFAYMKLMTAQQMESSTVKYYPAIEDQD